VVSTVLGSCIAVSLFSPRLAVGAICHALLPNGRCEGGFFKYVDGSILFMLERLERLGINHDEIEAKLFGGADMFGVESRPARSVGRQNLLAARDFLATKGIGLAASDVGGRQGRKLLFYPHTGEILLKKLTTQGLPTGTAR